MDALVIRWISLALVLALAALAAWAFADVSRSPANGGEHREEHERSLALEVHRPGQPAELVPIADGAVLGRSRACHIILDDETVSKEHARLRLDGRSVSIEDLHSTNGTLVNGKAIDGPTPLRRGDRIALGPNVIVFVGETS